MSANPRPALFLQRFFDPELQPKVESREELEEKEIERISAALSVVIITGSIPRRLGGDASDEELALDKKRAKRVGHALAQALRGWTKKQAQLSGNGDLRRIAAQLEWPEWRQAHEVEIRNRLNLVATWGILRSEERWAKSAVVKLENELNWVGYALRD